MEKLKIRFYISLALLMLMSSPLLAQHIPWVAPSEADKNINPLKADAAAIIEGKKIYTSMCSICHGTTGKGNGDASVAIDPHPANFLAINIKNESDGAIFWKMTEGRPPMASYKNLLTEQQRWQLVTYIRKLEEK